MFVDSLIPEQLFLRFFFVFHLPVPSSFVFFNLSKKIELSLHKPSDFNPKLKAEKCVLLGHLHSATLSGFEGALCERVSSVSEVLSRVLDQRMKGH